MKMLWIMAATDQTQTASEFGCLLWRAGNTEKNTGVGIFAEHESAVVGKKKK
jgi:hypothetical protein